ncbi:MAG: type II toxin-antitoxin system VapC family toxin [Mesorhizobium sp.]|nr:type II toxin-antitoxin system VapC family toxin [Mesorhizobium sp.]
MKISTLVDTNILVDVWGPRGAATDWSIAALAACRKDGPLVTSPIVWAELAPLIKDQSALDAAARETGLERENLPWDAAFPAGLAHAHYRRAGGVRERTLPDFLIGAHALVAGHRLLTRDPKGYRSYFPRLEIVSPEISS